MAKKDKKGAKKTGTNPPTRAGSVAPTDIASSAVLDSGVATPIPPQSTNQLPPYVGINFGNSYASIAVFAKEGQPECIANEDGERQIACAISFNGEEVYIGNQAKAQLVKNAKNTIVGFRNVLGKKFSEITSTSTSAAPIVPHPTLPDTPAYKVTIADPSNPSEGTIERFYTPKEVTGLFLKTLVGSAEAFLGVKTEGAVISIPEWFTPAARSELEEAAKAEAGIPYVLQLLEEAAAVVAVTTLPSWSPDVGSPLELKQDRTQLIVDLGSSSLSLSLLSIRQGLAYVLASSHTSEVGSNKIDDKLVQFFASDFTKKTKVPLKVCPAPADSVQDQRAEAKLRLAIEYTKRTLSASPGAAACSVESLKDGVDYTGTINRMRFDMVVATVYADVAGRISTLLENPVPYGSPEGTTAAPIDPHDIDEIVYVGGSTALPGLDERILLSVGLREDVVTPYARNAASTAAAAAAGGANEPTTSLASGGLTDPTTLVARGCASQAALISTLLGGSLTSEEDAQLLQAFREKGNYTNVRATTRTIGVWFPGDVESVGGEVVEGVEGGLWVPVVPKESALPVRRIVELDAVVGAVGEVKVVGEVWEVEEGIRIEKVEPPAKPANTEDDDEDDYDDEDEEPEQIKHRTVTKRTFFGTLSLAIPGSSKAISEYTPLPPAKSNKVVKVVDPSSTGAETKKQKGKKYARVRVAVVVAVDGKVDVELSEVLGEFGLEEEEGRKVSLSVAAP